jgi:hypothetical protein
MPLRLQREAATYGFDLRVEHIYLGRYISFNDEVRLPDIARAMEQAIQTQVVPKLAKGERFAALTHSTGGPVARTWWNNYWKNQKTVCPMSHLVMLAPANHGSALAQLGKSRLSRIKSWFDGVEPGQRVLDWLELGSGEAWELNRDWVLNGQQFIGPNGIFPFSLIGQDIDRKFYDQLNSYTGELGSDGVVRVAAANQNSRYIKLTQVKPKLFGTQWQASALEISEFKEAVPHPDEEVTHRRHDGHPEKRQPRAEGQQERRHDQSDLPVSAGANAAAIHGADATIRCRKRGSTAPRARRGRQRRLQKEILHPRQICDGAVPHYGFRRLPGHRFRPAADR